MHDISTFSTHISRIVESDVLVVGGGPAGIIAAASAAKETASVTLLERYGFIGGMMTAGEVRNIRVVNDGLAQWVVGDMSRAFIAALTDAGATYNDVLKCDFLQQNPAYTKHIADMFCLQYGVKLVYHSWACGAIMEEGALRGVYALGKDGICAYTAKVVVDATGDGDVAAFAGAAFDRSDGELQPMTTTFLLGGVESDLWPVVVSNESRRKFDALCAQGAYPLPRHDLAAFKTARKGEVYCNITRCAGDCTSTTDLTRAEIECRKQIFDCIAFLRRELPEFKNCYLILSAPQVGVRESRRIRGLYTLTEEDIVSGRAFSDAVAVNAYFVDIHHPGLDTTHYRREPGTSNGIPYGCLVPEKVDGLLMAGRCISATHVGHAAIRVMGTAMGIGQAAGTAAAMAVSDGVRPRDICVPKLQTRLREHGVPI